jgi:hypothetical protein
MCILEHNIEFSSNFKEFYIGKTQNCQYLNLQEFEVCSNIFGPQNVKFLP